MSGDKNAVRKVFTVLTSPVWVPVAAVGGLVASPFKAVSDSMDEASVSKNAAKGVGMFPCYFVGNAVTSPFKAVKDVGDAMWGAEESKGYKKS